MLVRSANTVAGPEDDHLLAVSEAARYLRVSQSTLWRWIKNETVPAYRVGPKRILLRQSDLDRLVAPARPPQPGVVAGGAGQRERVRDTVGELRRFQAELLEQRNGKPFPSSVDVLVEVREERLQRKP